VTTDSAGILAIARARIDPAHGLAGLSGRDVLVAVAARGNHAARCSRILAITNVRISASKHIALLSRYGIGIAVATCREAAAAGTIAAVVVAVARRRVDAAWIVAFLGSLASARGKKGVDMAIAT